MNKKLFKAFETTIDFYRWVFNSYGLLGKLVKFPVILFFFPLVYIVFIHIEID